MRVPRSLLGAVALLGLFTPASAHAQESPPRTPTWNLEWSAPPECPTQNDIERAIAQRVGDAHDDLDVSAVVRASESGYHVVLELNGAVSGVRELDATTCASLSRAVTLIVLLALDPNAATSLSAQLDDEPPEPAPAAAAPHPSSAKAHPPQASEAQASEVPNKSVSATPREPRDPDAVDASSVSAGLLVEAGWVPGVAFGALASVTRHLTPHSSAALIVAGVPSASVSGDDGLSVTLGWVALGARGCVGTSGNVELSGCARVRGALLSGRGGGGDSSDHVETLVVLLEAGGELRLPGPAGFGLDLSAYLTVPTQRRRFGFSDERVMPARDVEVFRLGVGASFGAALDYQF